MAIHYLNGATLQVLIKQFVLEKLGIVALATLLGWCVLVKLKMDNVLMLLMIFIVEIILMVGISLIPIYKLKNIELMLMLNQEDNLK